MQRNPEVCSDVMRFLAFAHDVPAAKGAHSGTQLGGAQDPSATFHSSQPTRLPTASPSLPALQKLHRLAVSSPDYGDNLYEVLHEEDYRECVANIGGDDLTWLVDYLDKVCALHRPLHSVLNPAQALDGLEPSSEAYRKCRRELRSICGTNGILPTSFTPLSQLQYTSQEPFADGAYGEVFHGTLDGSKVCIKRIKVYTKDSPEIAKKVCP